MAKNKPINLLPQEEFEASTLGRVLRWAMGTFRIIVIVTEVIVMAAFLSRFWLDAQNSDLTDAIKIRSAEISAQSDFEKEFRGVQTKLDIFKNIRNSVQPSTKVDLIASKLPNEILLTGIAVNPTTIEVKGSSGSELAIAQFMSNLKGEPTFKVVDLDSVNSSEANPGQTIFSIKISF